MRLRPVLATAAALCLTATPLTACGSDDGTTSADGTPKVSVMASFYPLQHAVEQVGGDHVAVTNLTKPGAEPHDLELSPRDTVAVAKADLVVYQSGFQPAVDDAAKQARDTAFDVTPAAHLDLAATEDGHDHEHGEEGGKDPHFWLDPMKYADVVDAVATRLAEVDPEHADDYRANATRYRKELTTLDREFEDGLRTCRSKELVTGHAAFGYLADAYGLEQESITLDPEAEPSAKDMAEVVEHVKEHGVKTVYAETLVPRKTAETIAAETGATVAVLDPLEGLTDESAGDDYVSVMRSNLKTLVKGQSCS
ncbi:metal ABC transporter substrate-binding protein [Janibacter massiliensis]|uniref:metal ABC transporter substrate-binding protein n=1 Tax=Janibacter massiliensis TaxID=2058291 RepID=UPI000D1074F2|nr:metal ABC transporter substrate-binding protein [Janibacter massiliensis]